MTLPAPELFTNDDVTEEQFKYQLRQLILSLYSRIDIDAKFFNRNQINEKFYDKDEIDALITGANVEALEKILHDVIEVALAAGAGAAGWTDSLIQTQDGNTQRTLNSRIVSTINDRSKNLAKRSLFLELPFIFADYEAAYAAVSPVPNGYLYPQGFSHDENDNTYINYAASSPYGIVLVKYDKNGVYKGWAKVVSGLPEDIVVKTENGVLKLYAKTASHVLGWGDISNLNWAGDTVNLNPIASVQSVHLQMDYDDGMWIIEQRFADLGVEVSRTKFRIYNDNFEQTGEFFTQRSVVGFQTSAHPWYNLVPKTQGVALKNGHVFFGTGGSYIPSTDGPNSLPVSAIGLAELSLDGSVVNYAVINARKYLEEAQRKYSYAIRTETEGLSKLSDGTITQLVILSNRDVNDINKVSGIIIEKLLDSSGDDYSKYKQAYAPFDISRFSKIFPRSYDGNLYNPYTQQQITTVQEIIDFLFSVDLEKTSWYSSAVSLTPLAGMDIPTGSLVTVKNNNNSSCILTVETASGYADVYFYNGTSLFRVNPSGTKLKLYEKNSASLSSGRIVGVNLNTSSEISLIQFTSTTSNNLLVIGGGSSQFNACSRVQVQLASDLNSNTGTIVTETTTTGHYPGADSTFTSGTSSRKWLSSYAAKFMWTATKGVFSGTGSPNGVVAAGVGSIYTNDVGGLGTTLYVKESGTGNTGWVAK